MRHRVLAGWIVGLALTASLASLNCGGDDDAGTGPSTGSAGGKAGAGGSGGTSTSGTAGKTGAGGSATGGSGGSGGSAGKGTAGSAGTAGAGTAGGGGSAGTGGSGGAGGQTEAGVDAPSDAPRADGSEAGEAARPDAGDAATSDVSVDGSPEGSTSDASSGDAADGAVAFSAVTSIFTHCTGCHRPRDSGAQRLDLATEAGLYDRLTAPLPDNQSGICGFGDGGTDGGDAAVQNRQPIVPGDPGASLLYLKVAGTQPAGCGQRMPRVNLTAEDGGPAGSTGCNQADGGAASNCLSQTDLDTILHWIEQGAPNN